MIRTLTTFFLLGVAALSSAPAAVPPKLVLVISVDQFRFDYLLRFRPEYSRGLDRLLTQGAVFSNAYLDHSPTVTAVGHATILTGATPAISGIIGNSWYDRAAKEQVTSVSDKSVPLVGGSGGVGSSPHRLMVSTVADELKIATGERAKVIGISMKDRAAILTTGHMADAAYWYDVKTGNFVSSGYYFEKLPDWARRFNEGDAAEKYAGKVWKPAGGEPFLTLGTPPDNKYFSDLRYTRYGNELVEAFAETAVTAEALGADATSDVLVVSFSSNDYVGHRWGPDSPQVHDVSLGVDEVLGRLFGFLDAKVGAKNYVVVLTADHGVAPVPEIQRKRRMPGGRMAEDKIARAIEERLDTKYGEGRWVVGMSGPLPYLNHQLAIERGISLEALRDTAADVVRNTPHVLRVYTYDELAAGIPPRDYIDRRLLHGFHRERGADLFFALDPYWVYVAHGASHGSPHQYDAHVPVIFSGAGIRPGWYRNNIVVNDIAPTVAAILGVNVPSGSTGRVLERALVED